MALIRVTVSTLSGLTAALPILMASCVGDLPAGDAAVPDATGDSLSSDTGPDVFFADGGDGGDAFTDADAGPCSPSTAAIVKNGMGRGIAPATSAWDLQSEMSIEYWLRLDMITLGSSRISEMTVMTSAGSSNAWFVELSPAYQRTLLSIAYGVNGKELSAPFTFQTAHWYHVAYEYDGATSRIFMGGQMIGSMAMTGAVQSPAGIALAIANWGDAANNDPGYYMMRELRIGNKALYTANFTPSWDLVKTTGTVALYHMMESNNVLLDATGQSPPITLYGAFSTGPSGVYCP